jgi:hypothetical protein
MTDHIDDITLGGLFEELESTDWRRTGGIIHDFDDGHIPENLTTGTGSSNVDDVRGSTSSEHLDDDDRTQSPTTTAATIRNRTRIVDYPSLFSRTPPAVHVYREAFPETLVDALYQKTIDSHYPSWGDYVTMEQVYEFWSNEEENKDVDEEETKKGSLLVEAVARYLKLALGEGGRCGEVGTSMCNDFRSTGDGSGTDNAHGFWTRRDLDISHGVAVWALRAQVGSQVPYHLDYAEQIRYHTNLIVPPLLAGTLQCTRDTLVGGSFQVAVVGGGVEHYRRHGYKERKLPISNADDERMMEIPYRYNQLTVHLGNLPHSSTKVEAIGGTQDRVIVGFNVFCHCAGPLVQRAPEHSDTFRRFIQVQKYISRTTATTMGRGPEQKLDLESLKRNRPLTKLLVLAKRERVKRQYRLSHQRLQQEVPSKLPATVEELVAYFSTSGGRNNKSETKDDDGLVANHPSDVRVFLHHQVQEGKFRVINVGEFEESLDGLISPMAKLAH